MGPFAVGAELSVSTGSFDPAAVCSIAMGGPTRGATESICSLLSRIHEVLGMREAAARCNSKDLRDGR
jgi:hypothetical protein